MDILLPIRDLLSQHATEALYYRLAIPLAPQIRFHWPSRGPDLRLARSGRLPENARPFPVDAPAVISTLAHQALPFQSELASPLLASLLAWQGGHFDIVEIPSTLPIAHLVRPASEAFAVVVGSVVQNWLGGAADVARLAWPDMPSPAEADRIERMEAESDSAVEMRFALAGACPPSPNGAPRRALGLAAVLADTADSPRPASGRLFAPAGPPEACLGPFLRLHAALPEPLRAHARLPGDLPPDVLRALAADPLGRELRRLAPSEAAVPVDCAPVPVFNPAAVETLRRGGRAIVGRGSWTAAVLDRIHPAAAPHGIDLDAPATGEAFAAALEAASPEVAFDAASGGTLAAIYAEATALAPRLAPVAVTVDVDEAARHELEASFPARPRCSDPLIAFVISAGAGEPRATAATLASLGRLGDLPCEAIVVVDETVAHGRSVEAAVRAAGRFARIRHQGRNAGLLPVLDDVAAPLVAFLAAGDRVAPGFGRWAVEALRDDAHAAAIPPWAPLRFAQPGRVQDASEADGRPGPAAVFRREVLAELGGTLGPPGVREVLRRVARNRGPGALCQGFAEPPMAFSEAPAAYAG